MSGTSSVQYKAVKSHHKALKKRLDKNSAAKTSLEQQLRAREWIGGGAASSTSDQLINSALAKIETNKRMFRGFVQILKGIPGLEDIAGKMSDMVPVTDFRNLRVTLGSTNAPVTGACAAGIKILEARPEMRHIGLITYSDSGERKECRPIDDISTAWEAIATQLKVDRSKIRNEKSKNRDAASSASEMMEIWLGSDCKASWSKLIKAMKVKQELTRASEQIKTALLNMVDSDDEDA